MMEWDIWQSWDLTGYFLQKGREEAGKEKSSCKLTYCSVSNYTFRRIFVKIATNVEVIGGYHWFRSKKGIFDSIARFNCNWICRVRNTGDVLNFLSKRKRFAFIFFTFEKFESAF